MMTRILLFWCVMLWSVAAFAQEQDFTNIYVTGKASIGTSTTPTGSLRLGGLTTSGGSQVLVIDTTNGEVIRRVLGKSDLPSSVAYEDESNTFSAANSFTSTVGITGLLSGNTGTLLLGNSRVTGTAPEFQFNETDQGTNLKNWRASVSGSQYSVQALDDSYGSLGDLFRGFRRSSADLYGGVGSPDTFQWGQYVRNVWPERNNTLIVGSPIRKIGAFYASEAIFDVMTVIEKQVIGNGSYQIGRGTTLTRDLGTSATVMFVKERVFRYGDFAMLQGLNSGSQPRTEWIQIVQAGGADCTGGTTPLPAVCGGVDNDDYAIAIVRNQDGTSADAWLSGAGVAASDRFLSLFAWASPVLSFGSAVLGDRPLFYANFNDGTSTTPNRARSSGSLTLFAGASAGGAGGYNSTNPSNLGAWFRSSDGLLFDTNISETNVGNNANALACSMTIEMSIYVPAPGTANALPVYKANIGALTTTSTFAVVHFGSASGTSGRLQLWATSSGGTWQAITPGVTPSVGYHHIAFTYSSDNGGRVYVDGAQSGGVTAPMAGNGCAVVTSNDIESNVFTGTHLDELAIYATELGAASLEAHVRALNTNRTGFSAGPTIAGYERTSDAAWYHFDARWACGDIAGFYGFTQRTYGCGWGDIATTYVTATSSDGFSIWSSGTRKFWADLSGNLALTGNLTIGSGGSIIGGNFTLNTTGLQVPVTNTDVVDPAFAYKWTGSTRGGNMFIQGYDFGSSSRNLQFKNEVTGTNQAVVSMIAHSNFPSYSAVVSAVASGTSGTNASYVSLSAGSTTLYYMYNNAAAVYYMYPSNNSTVDLGVNTSNRWKEFYFTPTIGVLSGAINVNPLFINNSTGQVFTVSNAFTGTCTGTIFVANGLISAC